MNDSVAEINWNPEALNALGKLISDQLAVKIGVLSDGQLHPGDKIGAAGLAAVHEFGSPWRKIPERSFLRKTSFEMAQVYMNWVERNKDSIFKSIMEGRLQTEVMPKIGAWWVNAVHDCFNTGGFGRWRPLKPKTVLRKKSNAILIDTGALKRSITFEVTDNK